jgi:hypothetical protein
VTVPIAEPPYATVPTQPSSPGEWAGRLPGWPTFVQELAGTLAARSQYVLQGNIRDLFLVPPSGSDTTQFPRLHLPGEPEPTPPKWLSLIELLWLALRPSGYRCLIQYDLVHGISVYSPDQGSVGAAEQLLGKGAVGSAPTLATLRSYLAAIAGASPPARGDRAARRAGASPPLPAHDGQESVGTDAQMPADSGAALGWAGQTSRPRVAFVIDYASRITRAPGNLDEHERDFFLFCLKLANAAVRSAGGPPERPGLLFNPIIWLVEGERDLPSWLTAGSELIRTIGLPCPDLDERTTMAHLLASNFGLAQPMDDQRHVIGAFASQTDGMTLYAMNEVARLALERRLPFAAILDALRIYKLGVEDNPWRRAHVRKRIVVGQQQITSDQQSDDPELRITSRVFGQDHAVRKTFDILKRAALGLSGAQAANSGTRPRGVIFFAGPTGVGKTELAKAAAELLFGERDSFLRFDMSEFAAEHADHRLIGAPPGYVGFEAGGELTSAVRRQPFRVVLFDEIDKAHKRVLDKFLQILEDGRLTDGQGITTYFSECVLIFTSNLGVMVPDQSGHGGLGAAGQPRKVAIVQRGDPYPEIEDKVRKAIVEHFTNEMGRPELLNRFGDNIVVFNFISDEAAQQIIDLQVANIADRVLREHQLTLHLTDAARAQLNQICTSNLDNGGRGIGNMLESALINPLARELFNREQEPGSTVMITNVERADGTYTLTIRTGDRAAQP